MKVTAKIKIFYKGSIYKPGEKVDIKGNIAPSWAKEYKPVKEEKQPVKIEADKTPEELESDKNTTEENSDEYVDKTPEELESDKNTTEENSDEYVDKTPEELTIILDNLINKAIEKDIIIEDADKKSVIEQIMELEKKLAEVQE
ncbi:MAG: hypothetical protein E7Z87_08190 [Cyanobacteria bacterium SIG26]|nr:hypothetical protein [Cyanobacteria bacterium SIG26]